VPAGTLAFGLMGDVPYYEQEVPRLDKVIEDMNAQPLAFVVHVGDITSGRGPCADAWLEARKRQFSRLRHPFVLLPGDNDWTDCHRSGFDPLERLRKWRALFCDPALPFAYEKQTGEYCEHIRWQAGEALFVTLNVQGSNDNLARTAAMDAEHAARSKEVLEWIADSERLLKEKGLRRLVLLMQANPFLKPSSGPNGYEALAAKLRALGAAHPGKLVLVHGDTHTYRDDEPLPGLRRIEVFGSPIVSWLRATATAGKLEVAPAASR
jgi:hypothetical protein